MEELDFNINFPSRSSKVRIYFISDWHVGAYGCDHELLERHVRHIRNDENGYVILGGDLIEAIAKQDRRYDSGAVHPRFEKDIRKGNLIGAQMRYVKKLVAPLVENGQVLTNIVGNHENKYAKCVDTHPSVELCEDLGIHFGGAGCGIRLHFKRDKSDTRRVVKIHAIHGKKGATSESALARALVAQMKRVGGCHVYFRGHAHHLYILPKEHTLLGDIKLESKSVALGASGAYIKILQSGGNSYAEEAEYDPTGRGCLFAEVQPFAGAGKNKDRLLIEMRYLVI